MEECRGKKRNGCGENGTMGVEGKGKRELKRKDEIELKRISGKRGKAEGIAKEAEMNRETRTIGEVTKNE